MLKASSLDSAGRACTVVSLEVPGELPISERRDQLCCGVAVVDLISGRSVATFQFLLAVEEIFAVDVIPNHRHPVFGGASHDERQQEIWVVPASGANAPTTFS